MIQLVFISGTLVPVAAHFTTWLIRKLRMARDQGKCCNAKTYPKESKSKSPFEYIKKYNGEEFEIELKVFQVIFIMLQCFDSSFAYPLQNTIALVCFIVTYLSIKLILAKLYKRPKVVDLKFIFRLFNVLQYFFPIMFAITSMKICQYDHMFSNKNNFYFDDDAEYITTYYKDGVTAHWIDAPFKIMIALSVIMFFMSYSPFFNLQHKMANIKEKSRQTFFECLP